MPRTEALPEALLRLLSRWPGARLEKIHAEASRRSFYRLFAGTFTRVAMVYPEPSPQEVEKFCAMRRIYHDHGLRVPAIDRVLADQVVLQEDLGDLLLQRVWRGAGSRDRGRLLGQCREILEALAAVPPVLAATRLDAARRDWEMDFFLAHFVARFPAPGVGELELRAALCRLVQADGAEDTFAHRDFHSRNILLAGGRLALVDFQDSLVAPRYYDLASLAFDSYLDLGAARGSLLPNLAALGGDHELRRLRLTALQRNIKALGTFGFQIFDRGHRVYSRYLHRTVRHIQGHLHVLADPQLDVLARYFASVDSTNCRDAQRVTVASSIRSFRRPQRRLRRRKRPAAPASRRAPACGTPRGGGPPLPR